jgi:hypothetical protein
MKKILILIPVLSLSVFATDYSIYERQFEESVKKVEMKKKIPKEDKYAKYRREFKESVKKVENKKQ